MARTKFLPLLILPAAFMAMMTSLGVTSAHATEICGDLPQIEWWHTTHSQIERTVRRRHRGNWDSYVKKWQAYENRLIDTLDQGRVVIVKSRDLKLGGPQLEKYIEQVAQRITVTKCLAAAHLEKSAKLDRAEPTAASTAGGFGKGRAFGARPGSDRNGKLVARLDTGPTDQVSRVAGSGLNLEIASRCVSGTAVFEVFNRGEKWPRLASVSVFRLEPLKLLSKRSLRLTKSQLMSFKVEDGGEFGEVGIRIEPSWADRIVTFDARINCARPGSR